MPLIQIKVLENELRPEQAANLIAKITDLVGEITSPKLRDATWVVIDEVKDGHWGIAGKPLTLQHVRQMIADK